MLDSEAGEEAGSMEGPVPCNPWSCYPADAGGAVSCGSPPLDLTKLLLFPSLSRNLLSWGSAFIDCPQAVLIIS